MLAHIALTLHGVLFLALVAVCMFDGGELAFDWTDCLIPLGGVLAPLALAAAGVARRSMGLVTAAALLGTAVGFVFVTGPGLFVLVPAILYVIVAARGFPTRDATKLP